MQETLQRFSSSVLSDLIGYRFKCNVVVVMSDTEFSRKWFTFPCRHSVQKRTECRQTKCRNFRN